MSLYTISKFCLTTQQQNKKKLASKQEKKVFCNLISQFHLELHSFAFYGIVVVSYIACFASSYFFLQQNEEK